MCLFTHTETYCRCPKERSLRTRKGCWTRIAPYRFSEGLTLGPDRKSFLCYKVLNVRPAREFRFTACTSMVKDKEKKKGSSFNVLHKISTRCRPISQARYPASFLNRLLAQQHGLSAVLKCLERTFWRLRSLFFSYRRRCVIIICTTACDWQVQDYLSQTRSWKLG